MTANIQPLDRKIVIVNPDGTPTLFFIKWAQTRQIDINAGITAAQAEQLILDFMAAHALQEGSGIDLTPDGNLANNPTITAKVQAILDQVTTTRGAILFRGVAGWAALVPGTTGFFLKTNGAGADPAWSATGGVPTTRLIATGTGLQGGGDLSADRTLSLNAVLDNLNDVDMSTPPIAGQVLAFDGTDWAPTDVATALAVKQDGTLVGTAATLNFTGSGVAVTDAGGGQIDVAISGSTSSPIYMPVVDGSIPPIFIQLPDGNLVYTEVA